MSKYYIEGNIDFFNELYKSLDLEEENFKTEQDDNMCLITNLPLTDKYVRLECGHKFNYTPLYNDLVNYKTRFIHMENHTSSNFKQYIRCPYCRNKQLKLLPYYEDLDLPKIAGINIENLSINKNAILEICEYIQEIKLESSVIVEKKCHTPVFISSSLYNIPNCNKKYCYKHKKQMFSIYKKNMLQEQKKLEKEELLKKKQEEKEKKKLAKEQLKESLVLKKKIEKELKKLMKHEQKKLEEENLIISNENVNEAVVENVIISNNSCNVILKSKKGAKCGCNVYKENMCKRHYNLSLKSSNKINDDQAGHGEHI